MRFSPFALLFVAILITPAGAQQSANPVTAHYRAYRAALEHGDLATADAEATAALETAQLDPHSVGMVAALAMNVALVRLSEGHRAGALAPAQLAASLATNPQSHADPIAVDIAVKRASLQTGDQSEADLLAALTAARDRGGYDEYVYDGAADLGRWATQQSHLPIAVSAWRLAANASPGDTDTDILSRAHALAELGVAMFILEAQSEPPRNQQAMPLPLSGNGPPPSFHPSAEIYNVLLEAARITQPLAERPAPDGSVTRSQLLYARALAFARAEASRLNSFRVNTSNLPQLDRSLKLPAQPGATLCVLRVIAQPPPVFPPSEANAGHVAGVVLRLVIDREGHVTNARVVAAVGGAAFEQAVTAVASRWRVERSAESPANCDMAMTFFPGVVFAF